MSLIGSLEDLGLGDILQIISLSQKSGVLVIRTDEDEGRIMFENGLVRGAVVKGGPMDLRDVLVGGELLSVEEFEAAAWVAEATHISLAEAVAQSTSISTERLDSLLRERVESAVVAMFKWRFGDFSFDVRDEPDPYDPPVFVATGLNAQYLAMEGSRIDDEGERGDEAEEETGPEPGVGKETIRDFFGVEDDEEEEEDKEPPEQVAEVEEMPALVETPVLDDAPADRVTLATEPVDEVSAAEVDALLPAPAVVAADIATDIVDLMPRAKRAAARPARFEEPAAAPEKTRRPSGPIPPVVVIDADLEVLEWIKGTLSGDFPRIHIFQSCELGMARIRQYLARAHTPLLIVAPDAPGDRMGGVRDTADMTARLRGQVAQMPILWLCEEGAKKPRRSSEINGVLIRPPLHQLQNPKATAQIGAAAEQLRETVRAQLNRGRGRNRGDVHDISPQILSRLSRFTARLSGAATRGEVLLEVINFAAESFSRIAMFVVRDDQVLGVAQRGLERAGGPDAQGLCDLRLETDCCAWFRTVLETGLPVRAAPSGGGDRALARRLGDSIPEEAYVAPLECAGRVVALLYADNLPDGEAIPDTSALEVALQHAGLSLDRAALERALVEVGSPTDS